MPGALLSATLIVRDEARLLPGCLESLSGRVDEIVVVDTGSIDQSAEIARAFGARVISFPWAGDFAAARNAAIDAAMGQWLLYIDADERVVDFDRHREEPLLADPDALVYRVLFRPARGYTQYREYRLYRKHPRLRFRGVFHESLLPAVEDLRREAPWQVGDSAIAIDHLGYEGDLRHKHERNLPLLRARLAVDPTHVYSWDHLGSTLLGLGDEAGAEAAWLQAIQVVRAVGVQVASDGLPYLHLAGFWLDRQRDALNLLEEGCRLFPEHHALAWLRARSLVQRGGYEEAMPWFQRLAQIDPDGLVESAIAFDLSIFGANAHAALGLCAFRLGRFAESAAHFGRAEALAPENLEFRSKRMLAELKARANQRR